MAVVAAPDPVALVGGVLAAVEGLVPLVAEAAAVGVPPRASPLLIKSRGSPAGTAGGGSAFVPLPRAGAAAGIAARFSSMRGADDPFACPFT